MDEVERVARLLCRVDHMDPDEIIPGNIPAWKWNVERAQEFLRQGITVVENGNTARCLFGGKP